MCFDYDPNDAVMVWPEGEYPAVIESEEEKVSKSSGLPMQVVTFRVYRGTDEMLIDDYIVAKTLFKLKKIATALGYEEVFKAGGFQVRDHIGTNLTITLGIKPAEGKYDEANTIRGYGPKSGGDVQRSASTAAANYAPLKDDDIPF